MDIVLTLEENEKTAQKFVERLKTVGNSDKIEIFSDTGKILHFLNQHPVDIVFLDIDENQSDWKSICEMVKFAGIRIWLMLIGGNPYAAVKVIAAGASDFLFKPVGTDQLIKALSKWEDNVKQQERTATEHS